MDHTQKSSISVLTKKNKILYLDILRALACLLVVMIHSSMNYAVQEVGSKNFWVGNFFDSISRAAVPLFVMISGALMLDENYHFTIEKVKKQQHFIYRHSTVFKNAQTPSV